MPTLGLTGLPDNALVAILALVEKHALVINVSKYIKILADNAQEKKRRDLASNNISEDCMPFMPPLKLDWDEFLKPNWRAFAFLNTHPWGVWGHVSVGAPFDATQRFEGAKTNLVEEIVRLVFGPRILIGKMKTGSMNVSFRCKDSLVIIFHKRLVNVWDTDNGCEVQIRDHYHSGVQPLLVNKRFQYSLEADKWM